MDYFDEAYVTGKYNVTPEALDDWTKAKPIAFPSPHIIEGKKAWAGEDLTMWDTCRLLEKVMARTEAAKAELDALLEELYSL
jgi:hypothetical protein